jgi:hypothetical protein
MRLSEPSIVDLADWRSDDLDVVFVLVAKLGSSLGDCYASPKRVGRRSTTPSRAPLPL